MFLLSEHSLDLNLSLEALYQRYVNMIPECKRPKLEQEITSDRDVRSIAAKLCGWDEKYDLLELRRNPDVHDIKAGQHKEKPALQRYCN